MTVGWSADKGVLRSHLSRPLGCLRARLVRVLVGELLLLLLLLRGRWVCGRLVSM